MWQQLKRRSRAVSKSQWMRLLAGLGVVALLLAACGSSNTSSGTTASYSAMGSSNASNSSVPAPEGPRLPVKTSNGTGQQGNSEQYGPQYLIKSLQVTMEVQNPTQSANDLQQWISFTDPQSTSDGSDYENDGSGQYTITLTFLVDVGHYNQVESYLRSYAGQKGHTLDSLKENVQDVTNDYVDSQSTLTNLRAEQQRLLSFMNQAQNVNDAINVEQQLEQVEGQIDSIEAHLNELKGQTTYYTVTVTIQPIGSAPPPPPAPSPWSAVPIWQGAWSSVVAVWQVLVAILIWLLAYSVYIIPAGILIWLIRKRPWKNNVLPPLKTSPAGASASILTTTAQPKVDTAEAPQPVTVPADESEQESE